MSSGWFRGMVQQVLGFIEPNSVRISPRGTSGRLLFGQPIGVEIESPSVPELWNIALTSTGNPTAVLLSVTPIFASLFMTADQINAPGFGVMLSMPDKLNCFGTLRMVDGAGDFQGRYTLAPGDGAIAIKGGTVVITKVAAAALTLAAPAVADDGKQIAIIAGTAAMHVLVNAAPGFNGGGAGADTATFGGAIGDGLVLVAHMGVWLIVSSVNVTLS